MVPGIPLKGPPRPRARRLLPLPLGLAGAAHVLTPSARHTSTLRPALARSRRCCRVTRYTAHAFGRCIAQPGGGGEDDVQRTSLLLVDFLVCVLQVL